MNKRINKPRRLRRARTTPTIILWGSFLALGVSLFYRNVLRDADNPEVALAAQEVMIATNDDLVFLPVPRRDVAPGETLAEVPFSEVRWPKSAVDDSFVKSQGELKALVATTTLPSGMPVSKRNLSMSESDANAVVESIPDGMRAITVRVDVESAVEGWARTGNYVDVIVIKPGGGSEGGLESKVIAENVRILSAGRSTAPVGKDAQNTQAPGTVTLLVSQVDALRIKTGASIGRLTFSLRGQGDKTPTLAKQLNQRELLLGSNLQSKTIAKFTGKAVGPDGQGYVLSGDNEWLRASDSLVSLETPNLATSMSNNSGTNRERVSESRDPLPGYQ